MKLTKLKLNQFINEEIESRMQLSEQNAESLYQSCITTNRGKACARLRKLAKDGDEDAKRYVRKLDREGKRGGLEERKTSTKLTNLKLKQLIQEEIAEFGLREYKDWICSNKKLVLAALESPTAMSILRKTLVDEDVEGLISSIEKVAGVTVDEIINNPSVQRTIKIAVNGLCLF